MDIPPQANKNLQAINRSSQISNSDRLRVERRRDGLQKKLQSHPITDLAQKESAVQNENKEKKPIDTTLP